MRKLASLASVFLLAYSTGRSTMVVYDPALHAQTAVDQVVNLAKFTATEIHTAATEINTLESYENSVVQLVRMGNPAALRSLPGVSSIAELYQIYGQLNSDYQQIRAMTNPQGFQATFNSILSTYKQPAWNGFTALNGVNIHPNQGSFQFPVNDWNVANNVQDQLKQLEQKKQTLTQQRDAALQSLQGATDQSTVQKLHSSVTALNGAIADINQSEQQLFNQAKLQQAQNAAAQQIYRAAETERTAASDLQAIDAGLSNLPIGQMREPMLWNAQP